MSEVTMTDLYYDLLKQVEQMTLIDQTIDTAGGALGMAARGRARDGHRAGDPVRRGEILYSRHGFIHGWAYDERSPRTPVVVRAVADGKAIATAIADEPAPTFALAKPAGRAPPRCGFVLRAFPPNKRIMRTRIDVVADGDFVLGEGLDVYPPSASLRHTPFEGHVEPSEDGRVTGWAWCRERSDARVEVAIFINGAAVARVPADRYREDLAEAGIGDGEHGFAVAVGRRFHNAAEKSVEVVIAENGVALARSPLVMRGKQIVARPPSWRRSLRSTLDSFRRLGR